MKLRIKNTETGVEWVEENESHSFCDFALDMMKRDKTISLVYCDIECISKLPNKEEWLESGYSGWAILDECGNWEPIPNVYEIEEVQPTEEKDD